MVELELDNRFKRDGQLVDVDHITVDWGDSQIQENVKYDWNKEAAQQMYDLAVEQYEREKAILEDMKRRAEERATDMLNAYNEYSRNLQAAMSSDPGLYFHTNSEPFLLVQQLQNDYLTKRAAWVKFGCFHEDPIIDLQSNAYAIKESIIKTGNSVTIVGPDGITKSVNPRDYYGWTVKPYCGTERAKVEGLVAQYKAYMDKTKDDLDREIDLLQKRLNAGDRSIHIYHYYNGVDTRTVNNVVVTPFSASGDAYDPITFKVVQTVELPTSADENEAGGGYISEVAGTPRYNSASTPDGSITVDDIPRLELNREVSQ